MQCAIALLALLAGLGGARAEEAFVTNQLSDDLTVVDLATAKPVATIAIGGKPAGVAVSHDGRFAYVTSPDAKAVTVSMRRRARWSAGSMSAAGRSASRWPPTARRSTSPTGTPPRCG